MELSVASSCIGGGIVSPVCQGASSVGSAIFGTGATAALDALSTWVGQGSSWLLSQIGSSLSASTTIQLGAPWFLARYQATEMILSAVALPLLLVAAIQALIRQSPAILVRAGLVQLPLAMVLAGAAVELATMAINVTDELCTAISGSTPDQLSSLMDQLGSTLVSMSTSGDAGAPAFVVLLGAAVVALATLALWVELVLRSAAIYVAVIFLPLALVSMIWPSLIAWSRRLAETLVALILSKLVVVVVLDLAVSALGDESGRGFSTVVTGIALLILATFAPFALFRLLPLFESSAAMHLEGLRQRATASMTHGTPRRVLDVAMAHAQATPALAVPAALVAAAGPSDLGAAGHLVDEDPMARSAVANAEEPAPSPTRGSSDAPPPPPSSGGGAASGGPPSAAPPASVGLDATTGGSMSPEVDPLTRPLSPRTPTTNEGSSAQRAVVGGSPEAGQSDQPPWWEGPSTIRWPRDEPETSPAPDPAPNPRWSPSLVIERDAIGPKIVMAPESGDG